MFVLGLGSVCFGQSAQQPAPKKGAGKPAGQLVVQNRVVDLGRILQGDKGTATFVLENLGQSQVHIATVRTSCGCTIPGQLRPDEKTMEPGEKLAIKAVFDSQGRIGMQRKTVTVTSDDPIEPRLQLILRAEVVSLMEVLVDGRKIRNISLNKVSAGESIKVSLGVLPTEPGKKLEITSVTIQSEALTYQIDPLTKDDRVGQRITLAVHADAQPGKVSTAIRINARVGGTYVDDTLRINGEIVGELSFTPKQIKQTTPMTMGSKLKSVRVLSEKREPFEILSTSAGDNLDVVVTKERDGLAYTITPTIRSSATPGPFGTYLVIRTSSVAQPVVSIPVFAFVRPNIDVVPSEVYLRQEPTGESLSRTVKLESARRGAIGLTKITADSPYVTAEEVELAGRRSVGVKHVRIKLSGDAPKGTYHVIVHVATTLKSQPEVAIPVTVEVP